ncbi:MAG: dihydrolipoyl dehydrogenase [Candidatus Glassbacteria bacterium]|nr:dihydrolipoyl dehydrogenase [Candidatus Glassbacteria bacterium]
MSDVSKFDLIVVGSGPGGYVAAIRASQLGMKTAIVEKERLGGVCLNWGCIPSKALLHSASLYEQISTAQRYGITVAEAGFDWEKVVRHSRQSSDRTMRGVKFLMKKNGIEVFEGNGVLRGGGLVLVEGEDRSLLEAENILLALGARARQIPGVQPDGDKIITSREALVLQQRPDSIVIVGGGAIGIEFAYLLSVFGTVVTVVELLDQILPHEDRELAEELEKLYKKRGIRIITGARVEAVETGGEGVRVTVGRDGSVELETFAADKVLLSVGVTGNLEGAGLDEAGVECERGFITTDSSFRTSAERVRAIGDCTGGVLLAHAASREGLAAVELIAGNEPPHTAPEQIPSCVYCRPQVASVGITEQEAEKRGLNYSVGRFPFRPLGKAVSSGAQDGFVKVLTDSGSGKVLGVHILGDEATEMIPEASLAAWLKLDTAELAGAVHPHPTMSEALAEAALDSLGRALHI